MDVAIAILYIEKKKRKERLYTKWVKWISQLFEPAALLEIEV